MTEYKELAKSLIKKTLELHGVPYNEAEIEREIQLMEDTEKERISTISNPEASIISESEEVL